MMVLLYVIIDISLWFLAGYVALLLGYYVVGPVDPVGLAYIFIIFGPVTLLIGLVGCSFLGFARLFDKKPLRFLHEHIKKFTL